MLPVAGQTAGPIGLTFLVENHGWAKKSTFFQNFFSIQIELRYCINSEQRPNRRDDIMFVDPDFVFIPNKKCIYIYEFCFKFTLDVIKRITKFTSRK